ncbi:hypothetical protein JL49_18635 [Pseudoalteromonas luteoviolacea]|nr:hypothetical protein JL49_18635 [Pseudoalteromonas luteoviolacea]
MFFKALSFVAILLLISALFVFNSEVKEDIKASKRLEHVDASASEDKATDDFYCKDIILQKRAMENVELIKSELVEYQLRSNFSTSVDFLSLKLRLNPFYVRKIVFNEEIHNKSDKYSKEEDFNLLRSIYQSLSNGTLAKDVDAGTINIDSSFRKEGSVYSLVGVVIKSGNRKSEEAIESLINVGVVPTLPDIIEAIKKIDNTKLVIDVIKSSVYDFNSKFYLNASYQSFLTLALKNKKLELAKELMSKYYNATPDPIFYTALDYAVRNYSSLREKEFLKIFTPLLVTQNYNSKVTYNFIKKYNKDLKLIYFKSKSYSGLDQENKKEINGFLRELISLLIIKSNVKEDGRCFNFHKKSMLGQIGKLFNLEYAEEKKILKYKREDEWVEYIDIKAESSNSSPMSIINKDDTLKEKMAVKKYMIAKLRKKAGAMKKNGKEYDLHDDEIFVNLESLIKDKRWVKVERALRNSKIKYNDVFLKSLYFLLLSHDSPVDIYDVILGKGVIPPEHINVLVIYKDNPSLITYFEEAGVSFVSRDLIGYTPLMKSIEMGAYKSFLYLLNKYGVQQDGAGLDALDIALQSLSKLSKSKLSNYDFPYISELINNNIEIKNSHREITSSLSKDYIIIYISLAGRFPVLVTPQKK